MNVLIGCECSGIIRDAFAARGHNAWSYDLKPTERPGNHVQGDLMAMLEWPSEWPLEWDLFICHPPCTYISYAATKYWNQPGRMFKRLEALQFFAKCLSAPIPKICIENPLGCADAVIEKHTQIIHPYFFGDRHLKRTCLWLKNLPKLEHIKTTDLFSGRTHTDYPEAIYTDKSGKKRHFTDAINGGWDKGVRRSQSFPGIANAMAEQWG